MDPLTAIGLGLGAVSLFSNIFGQQSQASQNYTIAKNNLLLQEKSLNQQRDLFNKSLSHQISMQREQNAFNEEQAWKMFNAENEYNSPQEQLNRAISAGLNPMTVAGANPVSASSSPASAASVSAPSQPQLVAPQMDYTLTESNAIAQAIAQSTAQFKSIADASHSFALTDRSRKTLDEDLRLLSNQNNKLVEETRALNISNHIKQYCGLNQAKSEILLNISKFGEALAHRDTLIAQGDYFLAEEYLSQVKAAGQHVANMLSGKELANFDEYRQTYLARQRQEMKELAARAFQEYQQGKLNIEQSEYYDLLGKGKAIENDLLNNEKAFQEQTFQDRVLDYFYQVDSHFYGSQEQKEEWNIARQNAEIAMKENKYWEFNFWFSKGEALLDKGLDIAGALITRGTSLGLREHWKRQDMDTYETTDNIGYNEYGFPVERTRKTRGYFRNGHFYNK